MVVSASKRTFSLPSPVHLLQFADTSRPVMARDTLGPQPSHPVSGKTTQRKQRYGRGSLSWEQVGTSNLMWRNSRITEEQGKAMSPKALVRDRLLQGKQSVKMNPELQPTVLLVNPFREPYLNYSGVLHTEYGMIWCPGQSATRTWHRGGYGSHEALSLRSNPQPSWHQGSVSWKTIFPWTRWRWF